MRSIVPIVEQLDRALAELAIDHPLNGRIALILVDNALELMCHQKCADLLLEDRYRNSRRLTPQQRSEARGRSFDSKIRFLKELGHISSDHVRAMTILHEYRNQLYHVGLRDDPIIGQLAHLYFRLAVGLLESLLGAQRYLRWEPEVLSDAARRQLPELATTKYRRAKIDMTGLRDRLLANCPQPPTPIEQALSAHLLFRGSQAESAFCIIAKGRTGADDPVDTLRTIQLDADTIAAIVRFRRDCDKALRSKGLPTKPLDVDALTMSRGTEALIDLNARLLPGWKPRHAQLPFENWKKRANSIGAKLTALAALEMFDQIRKEIDQMEEIMVEPIEEMYRWHQYLEDVAMDSR